MQFYITVHDSLSVTWLLQHPSPLLYTLGITNVLTVKTFWNTSNLISEGLYTGASTVLLEFWMEHSPEVVQGSAGGSGMTREMHATSRQQSIKLFLCPRDPHVPFSIAYLLLVGNQQRGIASCPDTEMELAALRRSWCGRWVE